jgi:hypothetical protein
MTGCYGNKICKRNAMLSIISYRSIWVALEKEGGMLVAIRFFGRISIKKKMVAWR